MVIHLLSPLVLLRLRRRDDLQQLRDDVVAVLSLGLGLEVRAHAVAQDGHRGLLDVVDRMEAVFEAQLITYLKLSGMWLGLLMNFNVPVLRDGIKRIVFD